jgi:hypothetical protein
VDSEGSEGSEGSKESEAGDEEIVVKGLVITPGLASNQNETQQNFKNHGASDNQLIIASIFFNSKH